MCVIVCPVDVKYSVDCIDFVLLVVFVESVTLFVVSVGLSVEVVVCSSGVVCGTAARACT